MQEACWEAPGEGLVLELSSKFSTDLPMYYWIGMVAHVMREYSLSTLHLDITVSLESGS